MFDNILHNVQERCGAHLYSAYPVTPLALWLSPHHGHFQHRNILIRCRVFLRLWQLLPGSCAVIGSTARQPQQGPEAPRNVSQTRRALASGVPLQENQ